MTDTESAAKEEDLISCQLSENKERIELLFSHCHDLKVKQWAYGSNLQFNALSVYLETLNQSRETYINATMEDISPLLEGKDKELDPEKIKYHFENHGISKHTADVTGSFASTVSEILNGKVVLFFDRWDHAVIYSAPKPPSRAITNPSLESAAYGPHNGTIEDLQTNLALVRGLLKTPKLKFESITAGNDTRKEIIYGYLEGAVTPENLALYKSRIEEARDAEILDVTFLEEWISESKYSPFPQVRYTERPDMTVAALLEGKIITLLEGSPQIMITPGFFVDLLSTSEDYYQRTIYSSLIRLMRLTAFIIALTLPSLYIAYTTFHPELIPTAMLGPIVNAREGIPFPSMVEALLMEFFFEMMREALNRLPRSIAPSVSIVGAIIIGQAAIQAKIASPIMLIVVSLTGIASFSLPQFNFGAALRTLRFPLMILAGTLGGYGLMIGYYLILLHLTSLKVLSQSYLSDLAPLHFKTLLKNVILRAPLQQLTTPRKRAYNTSKGALNSRRKEDH
ncbi:spore germination protein [Paenibacillus sepulcri]|uniref:Spore germination protein n=1 Tax=Paenibacillus sepulcri TaxID=359917 RepID=A0ABS7BZ94_9BACL|nr:spore germination protein [Paenibacillus sepulcri]